MQEAYRRWVCSTLIPYFAEPTDVLANKDQPLTDSIINRNGNKVVKEANKSEDKEIRFTDSNKVSQQLSSLAEMSAENGQRFNPVEIALNSRNQRHLRRHQVSAENPSENLDSQQIAIPNIPIPNR